MPNQDPPAGQVIAKLINERDQIKVHATHLAERIAEYNKYFTDKKESKEDLKNIEKVLQLRALDAIEKWLEFLKANV
jgi:hypothetical protein